MMQLTGLLPSNLYPFVNLQLPANELGVYMLNYLLANCNNIRYNL